MRDSARSEFNKKEIGARIKRLRKEAGLRQWQLAELVGATQPAIHMYERGVLPEPKRLLEIARIGGTTVEWILTGRHWEGGSEEMHRVPDEIYRLAFQLKEYSEDDRKAMQESMDIINNAVDAIRKTGKTRVDQMSIEEIARQIKGFPEGSRRALALALQIHEAVSKAVMAESTKRLRSSSLNGSAGSPPAGTADRESSNGRGKGLVTMRPNSIEAIRGHIFKLDNSMLVIHDILKDKDLRAEFANTVTRIHRKLESKKGKGVKDARHRG